MTRLDAIKAGTEGAALAILCESVKSRLKANPGDISMSRVSVFTASPVEAPLTTSAGLPLSHICDLGKHGVWHYHGCSIGWVRADINLV